MNQDLESEQESPSKTQRKKDMLALQQLGQKLLAFNKEKLAKLPLPAVVLTALAEYKRLPNSREARRRQLQYIGRLMRECDYEAIMTAIEELQEKTHRPSVRPGTENTLCDSILTGGDSAIQAALEDAPQLERKTLRNYFLEYSRADETQRQVIRNKLQKYLSISLV